VSSANLQKYSEKESRKKIRIRKATIRKIEVILISADERARPSMEGTILRSTPIWPPRRQKVTKNDSRSFLISGEKTADDPHGRSSRPTTFKKRTKANHHSNFPHASSPPAHSPLAKNQQTFAQPPFTVPNPRGTSSSGKQASKASKHPL
jgi:hypothetical protein